MGRSVDGAADMVAPWREHSSVSQSPQSQKAPVIVVSYALSRVMANSYGQPPHYVGKASGRLSYSPHGARLYWLKSAEWNQPRTCAPQSVAAPPYEYLALELPSDEGAVPFL